MTLNDEGFMVPHVDTAACINCGLCVKVCPALSDTEKKKKRDIEFDSVTAYGGWLKEADALRKSSSGGIFTALAEHIFSEGGCVFGVAWRDKTTAAFQKAENLQELAPMRGSKYAQAATDYVYREVKAELHKGRLVLFVGTSCQVYALQKYLRKPYERLLTADIICLGVPSRHLLSSYVTHQEKENGKEIRHINFRHKKDSWIGYHTQSIFTDGVKISQPSSTNMFMNLFLSGQVYNKCCYECPHIGFPRRGDITLGDYWGVQHLYTNWPIQNGISSIIATTEKGKKAIETLKQKELIELHPQEFKLLYNGQPHSYLAANRKKIPSSRTKVLAQLRTQALEKVHDNYYNHVRVCGFKVHRLSIFAKLKKIPNKLSALLRKIFSVS